MTKWFLVKTKFRRILSDIIYMKCTSLGTIGLLAGKLYEKYEFFQSNSCFWGLVITKNTKILGWNNLKDLSSYQISPCLIFGFS